MTADRLARALGSLPRDNFDFLTADQIASLLTAAEALCHAVESAKFDRWGAVDLVEAARALRAALAP